MIVTFSISKIQKKYIQAHPSNTRWAAAPSIPSLGVVPRDFSTKIFKIGSVASFTLACCALVTFFPACPISEHTFARTSIGKLDPVSTFFKTATSMSRAQRGVRAVGDVTTGELLLDADSDVGADSCTSEGNGQVIAFRTSGAVGKGDQHGRAHR